MSDTTNTTDSSDAGFDYTVTNGSSTSTESDDEPEDDVDTVETPTTAEQAGSPAETEDGNGETNAPSPEDTRSPDDGDEGQSTTDNDFDGNGEPEQDDAEDPVAEGDGPEVEENEETETPDTDGEPEIDGEVTESSNSAESVQTSSAERTSEATSTPSEVDQEETAVNQTNTTASSSTTEPTPEGEEATQADDGVTESEVDAKNAASNDTGVENLDDVTAHPDHFSAVVSSGTLKDFFADVGTLVDECRLHVGQNGIAVRSVDPANVGMIEAQLSTEAFDTLAADRGVLGLNIDRVTDVLGLSSSRDTLVAIEYDAEKRKLHFEQNGMAYTLATINPDSIRQEPDIPDLELANNAVVAASEVKRGIKAADMVAENAGIYAAKVDEEAEVQITAEGDTDTCEYSINGDSLQQAELNPSTGSLFSMDYLKNIRKAFPSSGDIEMAFGDEFPMKIIIESEESHKDIEIMLAPRVESN